MISGDSRGGEQADGAEAADRPARQPGAEAAVRRSAPVLSLEERKAQRQREREAARAERIAAAIASREEAAQRGPRPAGPPSGPRPAAGAPDAAGGPPPARPPEAGTRPAPGSVAAPEAAPEATPATSSPGEHLGASAGASRVAPAAAGGAPSAGAPRPAAPALGGVRPAEALKAGAKAPARATAPLGPAAAPLRPVPAPAATPLPAAASARKAAPAAAPPAAPPSDRPGALRPARAARPRARHWGVALSFVILVILPTLAAAWYLWDRASPRYASYAGFTVRSEEAASAVELLGVTALGGATTSDSDILYEFFQSQDVVARVDDRLDLRAIWSKGDPERDPIFAYHPPGTIEDLHDYWMRMVSVYTDGSTGLLDIEVQAFTPEDARAIAQALYEEGTILINRLSDDAQEQATGYAEAELAENVERLKAAREAITRFRNRTQIVDPVTAVQSQMGLLSQLESELAQTLIELDLIRQTAPEGDPRIAQSEARVQVIEARMAAERSKLGIGIGAGAGPASEEGTAFADLVGEYERLLVDQEFAETSYTAALTAYDGAVAEARRQSRYLAAHVQPTLAQRSDYPARIELTALAALFAFLAWATLTLAAYALRDRR